MDNQAGKEQSDAQLQDLWKAAQDEAGDIVGEEGLRPNVIPRSLDLESLVNEVQEKEHKFSGSDRKPAGEKKKLIVKALKDVINSFTSLCNLVSSAASMVGV
jgi:hypothetical protein